jgi:citronellol/citronellal dehydrogenase
MGKTAFITGATRGIGKACGLRLAREGWNIAVAGRSVSENAKLPGTIFSAAEEMAAFGVTTLPVQCNVADHESVKTAAEATLEKFGRIDAVLNNAGALWWRPVEETPIRRFDLVLNVNARGAFDVTSAFLPTMRAQNSGHIIFMSPPVDLTVLAGHVAYFIGKFGMTMTAIGLGEELAGTGVSATALWPKTIIESSATINFGLGTPAMWRKPDIVADALHEILLRPEETRAKALIDEDFLRSIGYTDFERYNCVEGGRPIELDANLMRAARV